MRRQSKVSRTRALLDAVVQVAPEAINSFTKPGQPHCVLATTIGQMILTRFEILSDPYPVELAICNRAWAAWDQAGFPGGIEEQQRRGAYLISNAPEYRGPSFTTVTVDKPWDGHLVLRVPDEDGWQWLVDLDLGAFNRPQHQIRVPSGVVAPLTADGATTGRYIDGETETIVAYRPLVAPYANDYLTARDWTRRARFIGHVDHLVQAVKTVQRRAG